MRLDRMLTFLAGWAGVAAVVAVIVGRGIRLADQRAERVPQLDVPLWRGTDLPDPPADDCGSCGAVGGDEPGAWHGHACPAYVPAPPRVSAFGGTYRVEQPEPPAGDRSWEDLTRRAAHLDQRPPIEPGDEPYPDEYLAGAILGLAFATDETTARYWLAMCARRGADADTLRELSDKWDRQHAADVQTLHTDREDD